MSTIVHKTFAAQWFSLQHTLDSSPGDGGILFPVDIWWKLILARIWKACYSGASFTHSLTFCLWEHALYRPCEHCNRPENKATISVCVRENWNTRALEHNKGMVILGNMLFVPELKMRPVIPFYVCQWITKPGHYHHTALLFLFSMVFTQYKEIKWED